MRRAASIAAVGLVLVACSDSLPTPIDAGSVSDAAPVDAGVDAMADADADAATDADGGRECTPNCFREVICRLGDCAGPITSDGCCRCLPGEVDDFTCQADAASDAPDDG